MNIDEAMSYIRKVSSLGTLPGLDRIRYIADKLGNPQEKLNIIHVAGTNGKGSFSAMLSYVLREAGYSVGLFTSPHMIKYNERINIDGRDITDEEISEYLEPIVKIAGNMTDTPSEFEITTALGYSYFADKKPDFCIIECGMGGRWDATNIISKPVLSVITGIALDHTAFLGDTVEKIAAEKSGIIKSGVPVIYGGDSESAAVVIKNYADKQGSTFIRTDRPLISNTSYNENGTKFDYGEYKNISLSLLGHYQPYNAANVIEAFKVLSERYNIDSSALYRGLSKARWIGRFEKLGTSPSVFFDGGHNPEGVRETVRSVKEIFGERKINIVSGVLADKDYGQVASYISSVAKKVYTVTPDSPRALSSERYADVFKSLGTDSEPFDTFDSAVHAAYNSSKSDGTPLLCVGSLYSYADFIKSYGRISK